MKFDREIAMAFLFGYFVILWPIFYAINGKINDGLIMGSVGVGVALFLWRFAK
jgi:hypothetical protein